MSLKIWIDGKLVDKADAKLSVYDHGLLYGDGVFEGIRLYSGRVFEPQAHLRRLFDSAKVIRLEIPYTPEQILAAIEQTAAANGFKDDCYVRVVVTRGTGDLGINPKNCKQPTVFVITDIIHVYPQEMYAQGMSVITSSYTRNSPNSTSARVKSLNYLNNVLAKIEANDAGVPEAIMLNAQGNVAECTADNIFLVRGGIVSTPSIDQDILEGVTRSVILRLCKELNLPCVERAIQRHDVYVADEMFVTGTGAEVMPVTKVDGRVIGEGTPGPITRRIVEAFHTLVRRA